MKEDILYTERTTDYMAAGSISTITGFPTDLRLIKDASPIIQEKPIN